MPTNRWQSDEAKKYEDEYLASLVAAGKGTPEQVAKWWDTLDYTSQDTYTKPYIATQKAKAAADPNSPVNAQAKAEADSRDITAKIKAFTDLMHQPVMQQLLNAGNRQAQGMGGGLGSQVGNMQASGQAMQAALPYLQQRNDLYKQGLGMQSDRQLSVENLKMGYAKMQNDMATQKWAADKNQMQGLGAGIGGLAGTALGAYLGGPEGAKVGASIGVAAGGGIGSLGGPSAPAYSPYYKPSGSGY
jgi:hypothetical protein